jgi:hypothetical protein
MRCSRDICAQLYRTVLVKPELSLVQSKESHEQSASVSVRLLLNLDKMVVYSYVMTAGDSVIRLGRLSL